MTKIGPHQIEPSTTDGQVLRTLAGKTAWTDESSGGIAGLTSADATVDITDNGDGTLDLSAPGGGGGGGSPTFHGCKAARTAALTTGNSAYTVVPFTAADLYDTDTIHDPSTNPSRFTVPAGLAGVWRFTASVFFGVSGTGVRELAFYINGTIVGPDGNVRIQGASSTETTRMGNSADLLLSAGNYVELAVRQTSGSSVDVTSATLAAHYLGAV